MKKNILKSKKFIKPSFAFLIEKKRDGDEFSDDEMRYIIDSILNEELPKHQLAALCMAIYFQGMSAQEIAIFAEELMLSGEVINLASVTTPKVETYATGGVGDKAQIALVPLAASCGVIAPSMVGSDEDFIFGSLEKLSAIPGFQKTLDTKTFVKQIKKINCAYVQQNQEIAPVDRILYSIRQSTATVSSLPLMSGCILGKKLASGAENLVVDVKWGNGSHIKSIDQAKQLGRSLTRVARSLNRKCVSLITDMNQPLGGAVGTALELKEVVDLLKGEGPEDLKELLLKLGMEVVRLSGVSGSTLSAKQTILKHLSDGSAFKKFKEMVAAQGGDLSYIDDLDKLPKAQYVRKLPAPKRGYIHSINSGQIARGVYILAKNEKTGELDHSVGVSEIKRIGVQVKQGEPLMMIHYNDDSNISSALEYLREAYRLAPKRPPMNDLIAERIA